MRKYVRSVGLRQVTATQKTANKWEAAVLCTGVWPDFRSAADRTRLNSVLRRRKKLGYRDGDQPSISAVFQEADDPLL